MNTPLQFLPAALWAGSGYRLRQWPLALLTLLLLAFSTSAFAQTLTGTVFEDVNYGGGAGRPATAAGTSPRGGATVELYNTATGAFVSTTTTTAGGQYSFGVAAGTGYTVRVVSATVSSSRTGYVATLLPVQTYNGTTDRVGGEAPALADAPANPGGQSLSTLTTGTQTPQSLATVGAGVTAGPDFGFNFDLIVNTNDAGRGSVRQFILNSNALGGEAALAQAGQRLTAAGTPEALPAAKESSIFMIPGGAAVPGQRAGLTSGLTGGVALIRLFSRLTTIQGANSANTSLDGSTQTVNVGNTLPGTLGTAGPVGTADLAGAGQLTIGAVQRPEVEIFVSDAGLNGVMVLRANTTVRGLALHGGNSYTVLVGDSGGPADGYVLENLLVGVTAEGLRPTVPEATTLIYGLDIRSLAGVGTVRGSYIAFTGNSGLQLNNGTGTVGETQIVGNFFFQNGYTRAGGDAITLGDGSGGSGPALVQGNRFDNMNSSAVQFEIGTTASTRVLNNTITDAGNGGLNVSPLERAGIVYLQRTGSTRSLATQADLISRNVVTTSAEAGIVVGYGQQNVTISQNSIFNNGKVPFLNSGLGIDLIDNPNFNVNGAQGYGNGDGVTVNDGNIVAAAPAELPNRGVDFPVITRAFTTAAGNLVIEGFSRPGAVLEFFNPGAADPSGFGEGRTYLATLSEGGAQDSDGGTGSYGPAPVNGLSQGQDAAASRFRFTVPLTGAFAGSGAAGSLLSATATLSSSTSEFSAAVVVAQPPVPNSATNVPLANTAGPTVLSPNLSATTSGTGNSIAFFTIASLPASGTLRYNGTVLTAANIATTQIVDPALLTYQPVPGFVGNATFTYTATDANGTVSTTNNTGGTIAPGPATYTIPVQAVADVTTTLSGPTSSLPGAANSYTVTFSNNGPNAAADVTRTVTLPAGATLTPAQLSAIQAQGGTVNGQVITYPTLATLASGAGNATSFTFSFNAPTTGGNASLVSNVGTSTGQGANTSPDQATLTIAVSGAPFPCSSAAYRTRKQGSTNFLDRLDRVVNPTTGAVDYEPTNLYTTSVEVNALSYNVQDGYLYAFSSSGTNNNTKTLYRYSQTEAVRVASFTTPGVGSFDTGTADLSGNLYMTINSSTSALYRLNISTLTLTTLTLSQPVVVGDIAYNRLDNAIYGNRFYNDASVGDNGLYKIQLTATSPLPVTILGTPAPGPFNASTAQNVGSSFFDAAGSLYIATNEGSLVFFDTGTGAAARLGTARDAQFSDAASCVSPTNDIDVVLSASQPQRAGNFTDFDVVFTAKVKNTGVLSAPNVQVTQFLNNGTNEAGRTFPGATVTVIAAPTVTSGPLLAVNPNFNGTTSPGLLAGTSSLAAGQTTTLTYTLRISYPNAGAVPGTPQNTQVIASVSNTANPGSTLNNGVAVPPGGVQANDRSTNSTTPPASANGDTPSPTPVNFTTPLPVELTAFTAQAVGNVDALLVWRTASEKHNDRFEVERSFTGLDFAKIGEVQGQGTSTAPTAYTLTDAGVGPKSTGLVYYRLRQVDTDGTASYSPVRPVAFSKAAAPVMSVYPNPATGGSTRLDLTGVPAGSYAVSLLDATGRRVLETVLSAGLTHRLGLEALASGTYTVLMQGTDGATLRLKQRLIKE